MTVGLPQQIGQTILDWRAVYLAAGKKERGKSNPRTNPCYGGAVLVANTTDIKQALYRADSLDHDVPRHVVRLAPQVQRRRCRRRLRPQPLRRRRGRKAPIFVVASAVDLGYTRPVLLLRLISLEL